MKGPKITAAIVARLEQIRPANGYATDVKGVELGEQVRDGDPLPRVLLRWGDDHTVERTLGSARRSRGYEIEGVFPKSTPFAELERFHHDVLRALGWGADVFERPIVGELSGDSAAIHPIAAGSSRRQIIITIDCAYTENY